MSSVSSSAHVYAKYDVLVWFEILELSSTGEYIPVSVDHEEELPSISWGTYLLHHGIQRRIRITLIYEPDPDIQWTEVKELVVGRVRNTPEPPEAWVGANEGIDEGVVDDEEDESVLSLALFEGEFLEKLDNREVFRFEAAWDTSLHNSLLLNRVTPYNERVYLTMSAYLEVRMINSLQIHSIKSNYHFSLKIAPSLQ